MLEFLQICQENLADSRGAVYAIQSLCDYIIHGGGLLPALCFVGSLALAVYFIFLVKEHL